MASRVDLGNQLGVYLLAGHFIHSYKHNRVLAAGCPPNRHEADVDVTLRQRVCDGGNNTGPIRVAHQQHQTYDATRHCKEQSG